jgi:anti-anti-sigma regulatory factor
MRETPDRIVIADRAAGLSTVLDLSRCSFIDSTGLRFVLATDQALAKDGRSLAVVANQSQIRKLLSLSGVDHHVRVFDGRDEAIAWVGSRDPRASEPALLEISPRSATVMP